MPRPAAPLLTIRAALILGLALITGAAAAALTFWADGTTPQALLTAGTGTVSTIGLLHQIIGDR